MASRVLFSVNLIAAIFAIISTQASAQSDCSSVILNLAPCLTYITETSDTPTSACCTQLSVILQSQPQCLCTVLGGSETFGITVNQTRAISLPGACNFNTPPPSLCNAITGAPPASSPPPRSPNTTSEQLFPPTIPQPNVGIQPCAIDSMGGRIGSESQISGSTRAKWNTCPLTFFLFFSIKLVF